ncbi:DUF1631 family protein [Marinobacter sp.]|uniref:DUF1631 family protein n=1 Tax=Marinobacter sp. TaxID=50741 RepID=UPI00356878BE
MSDRIDQVLAGIRVPDLPYPTAKAAPEATPDWRPLLLSCWSEQRDERVTKVLRSVQIQWSVRQVNAAYLSDRIMDVFLKTSGLHTSLVSRVARLRFWLAWRLDDAGNTALSDVILQWLDHLQEWRGWSDNGGRSSRILLEQLDSLIIAVAGSFESQTIEPLENYCRQSLDDMFRRGAQVTRLRERLYETELGASRQRLAEQVARALVGRALSGRNLPPVISQFIMDDWFRVLKQSVLGDGVDSELYRHANKILEWLVWVGDPELSDKDRNKLYQVGEQLGDRIQDVWRRALGQDMPATSGEGIHAVIVDRIRGEVPELALALPPEINFMWDNRWLGMEPVQASDYEPYIGHWFVEGEGAQEQRRFFFTLLEESQEVVWTNGAGVKLGLQSWSEFRMKREAQILREMPDSKPFGEVLNETVGVLVNVCDKQQQQRELAAKEARARAEALRREKEEALRIQAEQEAAHKAELARQKAIAEERRLADEQLELERLRKEAEAAATKLVEGIGLEGWISLQGESQENEPLRLKLAVKIAASRKFIFVDRLGLNRHQFMHDELVAGIVEGRIRILGGGAEFDDTLSRVVGRIRVGRN